MFRERPSKVWRNFLRDTVNVRFRVSAETGDVTPLTEHGDILSYDGFQLLFSACMDFYRSMSDDAIDSHNDAIFTRVGMGEATLPPNPTPGQKKRSGYVYLLKSEADHFKIGKTKDVPTRYKTVSLQIPHAVTLFHVISTSDMDWAEKYLHWLCKNDRLNGEWFALDDYNIYLITACTTLEYQEDVHSYMSSLAEELHKHDDPDDTRSKLEMHEERMAREKPGFVTH